MDGIASIGKMLIYVGIMVVVFGGAILLLSRLTGGRGAPLPGDIVVHGGHVTFYFPIITSILVSLVLTLIFWLLAAIRR
jgi:hypothetical protein